MKLELLGVAAFIGTLAVYMRWENINFVDICLVAVSIGTSYWAGWGKGYYEGQSDKIDRFIQEYHDRFMKLIDKAIHEGKNGV